ncbi:lipocalin-like domain-containing protein [Tropicimonas sp. S265A]|uniref:lipocalin-like domain-containing protein n=1 Tax=Tropicimonas sp. S265A TaxID=3415134 RepID=UPI003C7D8C06
MNVRPLLLAGLFALGVVPPVGAQGFAGLGEAVEDSFTNPEPNPDFDFPADHGAHPDYRIEWWYLTANLTGPDGQEYGIQWTLFRSALAPTQTDDWDSPQIWMGHAGLTTQDQHFVAETLARDGIGQAGVSADPFVAYIDDWEMRSTAAPGADALSALELSARGPAFSYALELTADGPLVFQGDRGFSVKSESGQASYYYSQPFYEVSGMLNLPGSPVQVTGSAWLDREWSSQPLDETQSGWDWFSLHLETGERVMGFRLRSTDGADYTSGTWIAPDGASTPLPNGAFQIAPLEETQVNGRMVPTAWQVRIPDRGLDIRTRPLNAQSWMDTLFPYWEGPIRFDGTHSGRGYLEMTGYE